MTQPPSTFAREGAEGRLAGRGRRRLGEGLRVELPVIRDALEVDRAVRSWSARCSLPSCRGRRR
jgi:hypothetical protein